MQKQTEIPHQPAHIAEIFDGILPYIKEFLCSPHPYRKGPVCPFVPSALKKDQIFFTYMETKDPNNHSVDRSKKLIQECIDFYRTKKNRIAALIILFPRDFEISSLLHIHLQNKIQCVTNSLMLGALWERNQAMSLHCKEFFPLRTPTPVLVIRVLTVHDLIFLDPEHYNIRSRISFLNAYIKKFSENSRDEIDQAIKLKDLYQRKIIRQNAKVALGVLLIMYLLFRILFNAH